MVHEMEAPAEPAHLPLLVTTMQLLFQMEDCFKRLRVKTCFSSSAEPKISECKYLRRRYSFLVGALSYIEIYLLSSHKLGKHATWNPPVTPRQLMPDKGEYFRDSNAASQRAQAVLHQNPDITTHDIDIFTCASDFGNLSHCVHGVEQTFRFVMEAVGGTVFFVRRENSPTLLIPGIRGYGHNFVDEYTAWGTDVKGSTSHQGLRFAVRFQSDRFIEKEEHKARATPNSRSPLDALADASIDTNKIPDRSALTVEEDKQRGIPQNDVRDIKTRYMGGLGTRFVMKDTRAGINPRLWRYSETRRARRARKWERDPEDKLRQLASLFRIPINTVMEYGEPLEVYSSETGLLEIRIAEGEKPALPPGIRSL
ncbi:conserved hypothetical protein [Microsporum canis CBS 113480]|uniref:Geranylgeranyl pyrophosphate synthetase n=1 Tax=Arthroderma otae (strain ATCC MYA-4605 / CBS 113480) TaxID=554155 RepID=C5FR12_ARTOC|nr:conserved hypothetical protein [Microsporum canis CBS 113480]EEQ32315.1 conserved hypothetical protein [Microsporum canis CBS 113480]